MCVDTRGAFSPKHWSKYLSLMDSFCYCLFNLAKNNRKSNWINFFGLISSQVKCMENGSQLMPNCWFGDTMDRFRYQVNVTTNQGEILSKTNQKMSKWLLGSTQRYWEYFTTYRYWQYFISTQRYWL